MSPDSINRLAQRQHQLEMESPVKHPPSYFPFLFGNDVDSVDVATRVRVLTTGEHAEDSAGQRTSCPPLVVIEGNTDLGEAPGHDG